MWQKSVPFCLHCWWQIERRNSKGRSGYTFWLILQKPFAAFSHRQLKVIQIWSTHQSKALTFYFDMKNFFNLIFENFWKTDKVNFTDSNLMCVYTHSKFQNMKVSLSVSHKIFKSRIQKFFMLKKKIRAFNWVVNHM